MPDSIREQILAAFATRMSAVRGALPGALDDRASWPVTGMFDEDETAERRYGKRRMTMRVRIEQLSTYGADGTQSTAGNALLANMISTALNGDPTFSGLADDIQYAGGAVVVAGESTDLVGAFALFDIEYRTDLKDPFTLT